MKKLFDAMQHRTLWQVLAVYLGASWVLLQAVDVFANNMDLPGWVFPTAGILLLIGLPIVLATLFIQRSLAASGEVADEAHEKLFTWRNVVLGGAGAFLLLFGFGGLYVLVQDRGESFQPADALADEVIPGVAVLPFSVRGPDTDMWREGIVDLLTTNLEGISGLRPISTGTVLARWSEIAADATEVDEATETEIARSTGARYAGSGSLVGTAENIRLSESVIHLEDGKPLGQLRVEGSAEDIFGLVDRFSVEVVRVIGTATEGELGAIDLSQVTTSSPAALRHYLIGSSLYRHGDEEAAVIALDSAVAADSTFALALYRLARAVDGQYTIDGRTLESVELLLQARELTNPPRLDLLIRGQLAEYWANGAWVPGFDTDALGETIADLEAAVRRDPSDAESWQRLGELYWHSFETNPLWDGLERAIASFERNAELVPDVVIRQFHLYMAYFRAEDSLGVKRLLAANERTAPGSVWVRTRELIYRAAFDGLSDDELAAVLDSLRAFDLGLSDLRLSLASNPVYWPVVKASYDPQANQGCWERSLDAGDLDWYLENAANTSNSNLATECYWRAYAYGLPVSQSVLDSAFSANPDHGAKAVFELDRGEYDQAERLVNAQRASAALARAGTDSTRAANQEMSLTWGEAYLDWKRDGQPARAASRMQSIARILPSVDLFLTAQMLAESGQTEEAALLLQVLFNHRNLTVALYRLGPLYEELGETDKAREAYAEFAERWKNADPQLQPWVDTARAALVRLGPLDQ